MTEKNPAIETDFEEVQTSEGAPEIQEYEVVSQTLSLGKVETNFGELIPTISKNLEFYKTIKATPDNLKSIYDMRAKLRKTKDALKEEWKKAKDAFDKPLADHEAAYKQLLAVVDDAINALDTQYKNVDMKLKEERYNERAKIVDDAIRAQLTPDEIAFYESCDPLWTCNIKWENKDYKQKEIDADIERVANGVKNAWSMLEGDYRPQMLEVFAKTGDLGKAMAEGKRLKEQSERFAEAERMRKEREEAARQERMAPISTPATPTPTPAPAPLTAPQSRPVRTYQSPDGTGQSPKICKGTFTIRAPRYLIQWLLDVAKAEGISVVKEAPNNG